MKTSSNINVTVYCVMTNLILGLNHTLSMKSGFWGPHSVYQMTVETSLISDLEKSKAHLSNNPLLKGPFNIPSFNSYVRTSRS